MNVSAKYLVIGFFALLFSCSGDQKPKTIVKERVIYIDKHDVSSSTSDDSIVFLKIEMHNFLIN